MQFKLACVSTPAIHNNLQVKVAALLQYDKKT